MSINASHNLLETVSFSEITNWSVPYLKSIRFGYRKKFSLYKIADFLGRNRNVIEVKDDIEYKRVTVKLYNKGVIQRDQVFGVNIGTKKQFVISQGQFILSKIDARNGAFGLVPQELDGAIVTADFLTYNIDKTKIYPYFLTLITSTEQFLAYCQSSSSGTTGRQRIQEDVFLNVTIPLPDLKEQKRLSKAYRDRISHAEKLEEKSLQIEAEIENFLFKELGIQVNKRLAKKGVQIIGYKDIFEWGADKLFNLSIYESEKFPVHSFLNNPDLLEEIFRGRSPQYQPNSDKIVLNQKCNRWNNIQLEHAKTVNSKWLESIEENLLTKEDDVIVNSTGEGTIGRASWIPRKYSGLFYDSHILLVRTNHRLLNPLYYVHVLNSLYGQDQIQKIKSAQSTQQTELGASNLKKILIPLPPIKVQNEIALKISKNRNEIADLRDKAKIERQKAVHEFEKEIFT